MASAAVAKKLGKLPSWDLNDLYPGRDSKDLKNALAAAANERFQRPVAIIDQRGDRQLGLR